MVHIQLDGILLASETPTISVILSWDPLQRDIRPDTPPLF